MKASKISVRDHIAKLIKTVAEGIYEKEHILSIALLSALAGESIFLLGPPGTAKSMIARRLKLIFSDATSFEYLMSRFSTPDELFGPVSISKLKNEDRYERKTEGFLPSASVVFLDEIWKAGPSIQNSLLTALNERIYLNGSETVRMKMKLLIAASNELPAEDEGLEALWDRFLVREVSNCVSSEKNFYKMVTQRPADDPKVASPLLINDELYNQWQEAIDSVEIPESILHQVTDIRRKLNVKRDNPMDFYVSDRRWKKVFRLMRASAFLNGRQVVDSSDLALLFHTLWNKVETIDETLKIVASSYLYELDARLSAKQVAIERVIRQIGMPGSTRVSDEEDRFEVRDHFYYVVENYPDGDCVFPKVDYNHVPIDRDNNGVKYYDEKKKCWQIHAFYTSSPIFNSLGETQMTRVKLRKCPGGLMINGTIYAFERRSLFEPIPEVPGKSPADVIISELQKLRADYERSRDYIANSDNLFISDSDSKLILRQFDDFAKRLDTLIAKAENTRLML